MQFPCAQFFHAPEVDRAGTAVSAIDGTALVKQQLRQVGAILGGDQGGFLHGGGLSNIGKYRVRPIKNNSCLRFLDVRYRSIPLNFLADAA